MNLKIVLFFLFVYIIVMTSVYGYIGFRIIRPARISRLLKAVLWVILFCFMLMPGEAIIMHRLNINGSWIELFCWIAYLSLGFFNILFIFLIFRDIASLLIKSIKKIVNPIRERYPGKVPIYGSINLDRRKFILNSMNLGFIGLSGLLTGYGIYESRRGCDIKRISVPINNLPDKLDGIRIVQITDVHLGLTIKREYFQNIIDKVNRLNPDIIAITGDLVDGTVEFLKNDIAPLADLRARYGSFFVTGNHEYFLDVESWEEEIDRLGITVLKNEHKVINFGKQKILIAGITDYTAHRYKKSHTSDPELAIYKAPPCSVKILLAHQPRSIYAAAKYGFDLQISGHTHGGQYFPWYFFIKMQQPYLYGLHKFKKTWVYVSRGAGYWGPPLRLGAPAEIAEITLRRT